VRRNVERRWVRMSASDRAELAAPVITGGYRERLYSAASPACSIRNQGIRTLSRMLMGAVHPAPSSADGRRHAATWKRSAATAVGSSNLHASRSHRRSVRRAEHGSQFAKRRDIASCQFPCRVGDELTSTRAPRLGRNGFRRGAAAFLDDLGVSGARAGTRAADSYAACHPKWQDATRSSMGRGEYELIGVAPSSALYSPCLEKRRDVCPPVRTAMR
jgi:hypothetical protein